MNAIINALDELAHISPTDTTEARAELAALAARLETAERERDELYKLVEHLQEMNDDALLNDGGAWSRGGATYQRVLDALKARQA